ncbi:MAG: hypothetical protein A2W47_00725 [Gammaproteobacteria bacterium RIFCSPHIGHO2_12_38_15]|nr:MAG: hypothetical protein A2W47_00725 [Gammaproteobacteria bacterium RIFCSPHIGHO2_12_38_15]
MKKQAAEEKTDSSPQPPQQQTQAPLKELAKEVAEGVAEHAATHVVGHLAGLSSNVTSFLSMLTFTSPLNPSEGSPEQTQREKEYLERTYGTDKDGQPNRPWLKK